MQGCSESRDEDPNGCEGLAGGGAVDEGEGCGNRDDGLHG